MGFYDTAFGIILLGLISPMGTFLLRQFFQTIPAELEESARMDGCNNFVIFTRIFIPLSVPTLLITGLMSFMTSWNSLVWPMIITRSQINETLPIGLLKLSQSGGSYWNNIEWGVLMSGTFLSLLPIVIIYLIFQKSFIQGVSVGSVTSK